MSEIDPRDARIAQLEAEVAELKKQLAEALATIAGLRARLGQNSRNSNKPPSSDGPAVKRERKEPSGRKPGGQPGHKGHRRELLPPEKVDEVVAVQPKGCSRCGGELEQREEGPAAWRHQVVELPEVKPRVTEYQLRSGHCARCEVWTQAQLPPGVPSGAFGPRLTAVVALLTGRLRLTKRLVQEFASSVLGVEVALGSISKLERSMSAALQAPVEEARAYVREALSVNADETSWREKLKKAWLWVAATALVTVFSINRERSGEAARQLLGEDFVGFVGSDRWSGYNWVDINLRQLCWAHLRRDFQKWVDRGGAAKPLGRALLGQTKKLFALYHQWRDGTLPRPAFQAHMGEVEAAVARLLRKARVCPDQKVAGMAEAILKLEPALWAFVHMEEVEPTNNRAERALRPAVCMRKGSFGTHSPEGSRYIERMLTAVTTLKQQQRHVLDYLTEAMHAHLHGHAAPSLLPVS
ncbi:IS66 family transposase [Archangium gephyra]|uniref:IS66 family transposase n=1 Tax=Archangium gephyra TaxID=48 RepID=UPI003B7DA579